jgi:redox-sensitive bicupin YhaK (pirin superfamily)
VQWVTAGCGVIHAELAHCRRPVQTLQLPVSDGREGPVLVDPDRMAVQASHTAWFPPGDPGLTGIEVRAEADSEVVMCSDLPIGGSVFAYGPFVMNTRAEIVKAIEDSRPVDSARFPQASEEGEVSDVRRTRQ